MLLHELNCSKRIFSATAGGVPHVWYCCGNSCHNKEHPEKLRVVGG